MGEQKNFPVNSIRVCIDEKKDGEIRGILCGVAIPDQVPFLNTMDLMMKIDDCLNNIGVPQAFQTLRTFGKESHLEKAKPAGAAIRYRTPEEIMAINGKCKTFDVVVSSRQRSCFQGNVKDTQGKILGMFDSDLELLKLLMNS